jgi:hypothetical protein
MDCKRKQPTSAPVALPRSRLTEDIVGLELFPEEGLWSQYEEFEAAGGGTDPLTRKRQLSWKAGRSPELQGSNCGIRRSEPGSS